jgi:hypothetical protein
VHLVGCKCNWTKMHRFHGIKTKYVFRLALQILHEIFQTWFIYRVTKHKVTVSVPLVEIGVSYAVNMTPCSLVRKHWSFGGIACLSLQVERVPGSACVRKRHQHQVSYVESQIMRFALASRSPCYRLSKTQELVPSWVHLMTCVRYRNVGESKLKAKKKVMYVNRWTCLSILRCFFLRSVSRQWVQDDATWPWGLANDTPKDSPNFFAGRCSRIPNQSTAPHCVGVLLNWFFVEINVKSNHL